MTPRRYQVMYILTRHGLPVVIRYGRDREPDYRSVGEAGSEVPVFKTLRAVARHIEIASSRHPQFSYGYVMLSVPT